MQAVDRRIEILRLLRPVKEPAALLGADAVDMMRGFFWQWRSDFGTECADSEQGLRIPAPPPRPTVARELGTTGSEAHQGRGAAKSSVRRTTTRTVHAGIHPAPCLVAFVAAANGSAIAPRRRIEVDAPRQRQTGISYRTLNITSRRTVAALSEASTRRRYRPGASRSTGMPNR